MPKGAKKSGAYHHGDLRRVLIDAAIRVVEKHGVDALTLQALARKAGVSSGAPYHHFKNREMLLAAIAVDGFELLTREMTRCVEEAVAEKRTEKSSVTRLRGFGRGYVRFALKHSGHFRVMFRPESKRQLDDEQRALVDGAFDLLMQCIAGLQSDGLIAAGDVRPIALLAWSSVHGASTLWVDGPLADDDLVENADALGPAIADTLLALITSRAGK